jgi:hypothetical protein
MTLPARNAAFVGVVGIESPAKINQNLGEFSGVNLARWCCARFAVAEAA